VDDCEKVAPILRAHAAHMKSLKFCCVQAQTCFLLH